MQREESSSELDAARSIPPPMRQAIVDLKAEYSGFTPNELVAIGYLIDLRHGKASLP